MMMMDHEVGGGGRSGSTEETRRASPATFDGSLLAPLPAALLLVIVSFVVDVYGEQEEKEEAPEEGEEGEEEEEEEQRGEPVGGGSRTYFSRHRVRCCRRTPFSWEDFNSSSLRRHAKAVVSGLRLSCKVFKALVGEGNVLRLSLPITSISKQHRQAEANALAWEKQVDAVRTAFNLEAQRLVKEEGLDAGAGCQGSRRMTSSRQESVGNSMESGGCGEKRGSGGGSDGSGSCAGSVLQMSPTIIATTNDGGTDDIMAELKSMSLAWLKSQPLAHHSRSPLPPSSSPVVAAASCSGSPGIGLLAGVAALRVEDDIDYSHWYQREEQQHMELRALMSCLLGCLKPVWRQLRMLDLSHLPIEASMVGEHIAQG
jgi:hypothetical protein